MLDTDAAAQRTIANPFAFAGMALHSGRTVQTKLLPAEENSGIVFRRTDVGAVARAHCDHVADTRLSTTISQNGASVGTVEHLLSALAALQIDNLTIEVDGAELPILDGSAAPWLLLLSDACGIATQQVKRRRMRVLRTVEARVNDGWAKFSPAVNGAPNYKVRIDYPHEVVRRTCNECAHCLGKDDYEEDISRARTFCYVNDVELMRKSRRALGGSLGNALVYDDKGVLNTEGMRYPDEFVRHKLLDAIGDCYINGCLIIADYESERPGHGLNNTLMRALFADKSAWEWDEGSVC